MGRATQQDVVSVRNQHDHDGVGAGEMHVGAGGAKTLPAPLGDNRGCAAVCAKLVVQVPRKNAFGGGGIARMVVGQVSHDGSQVYEL